MCRWQILSFEFFFPSPCHSWNLKWTLQWGKWDGKEISAYVTLKSTTFFFCQFSCFFTLYIAGLETFMFKLQPLQKIIAQTFIAEITQINDQDCCHKKADNPSLGKILDSGTNRAISPVNQSPVAGNCQPRFLSLSSKSVFKWWSIRWKWRSNVLVKVLNGNLLHINHSFP